MQAEVVVDGIRFGEGPVWCPDGTLVVTSVSEGALYRVEPERSRFSLLASTGGGANGAALADDGSILVTQNGGVDFSAMGLFEDPPPHRPATPGLQRAEPDGRVTYLLDEGFTAPNDLVVAADGTVYFTDPPHYPPPDDGLGRIWAYHPDGTLELHADGFWLCNGIAFDPGGDLVVIERLGILRLEPDGSRPWIVEHLGPGGGDGFCVDADGRYYVAATIEHCVRVIEDGRVVEQLEIPGEGLTTNCCFGGPTGRDLYATDALPGRVVVWESLPTAGLPMHAWPVPPPAEEEE